jgi:hypothetical protein
MALSFSNHYSNIERVRMDWLDKLAVEIEKPPKDTWRVFRRNVLSNLWTSRNDERPFRALFARCVR